MRIEEIIGARVTELRADRNLTQTELGERIGLYLGAPWSRQAVSAAEHGGRAFTAAELLALADVLDSTIGAFFLPTRTTDVPEIETPAGAPLPINTVLRRALGTPDIEADTAGVRAHLRVAEERERLEADKLRLRAMLAEYAEEAVRLMRDTKDECLAEITKARAEPADRGDTSVSLTVEDLAERERVKPGAVRAWVAEGEAPRHYVVGKRGYRFRLADVEAWEHDREFDPDRDGRFDAWRLDGTEGAP